MSRFFTAHWTTALLLGALAANTHAQDAAADFAQKLPLNLVGNGPWYQLNIGMPVQLGATHADLRDLRVFDWAWRRRLPLALSMGGGYGHDIGTTVQVQINTFGVALQYRQRWQNARP